MPPARAQPEPVLKPTDANNLLSILQDIKAPAGSADQQQQRQQQQQPPSLAPTRMARELGLDRPSQTREMVESERREQFQRQIYRKWQSGDVYSPHDLTGFEQKKWKFGRKKPQQDAFDVLGINPINEYKVRACLAETRTETSTLTRPELHNHVRIHDRDGADKALQRYRSATEEPKKSRQGHTESHWAWPHAQCAQASIGSQREPANEVFVRIRIRV